MSTINFTCNAMKRISRKETFILIVSLPGNARSLKQTEKTRVDLYSKEFTRIYLLPDITQ